MKLHFSKGPQILDGAQYRDGPRNSEYLGLHKKMPESFLMNLLLSL